MLELDNACVHQIKVLLRLFVVVLEYAQESTTILCVLTMLMHTNIIIGTHIYRERRFSKTESYAEQKV